MADIGELGKPDYEALSIIDIDIVLEAGDNYEYLPKRNQPILRTENED